MNKQYQEDTDSSQFTGLGQALKQGRENKNFSVSRVADGLHLRPSIVTAIEDENYELLPGDLFLKGYIRSYARLVGLDEEKMINLLDQRLSDKANEQAEKKQALGKAKRKKHSKHALLILVLAGIVGAVFYMWSQRLEIANSEIFDTATEAVTNSAVLDTTSTDSNEVETPDHIEMVEAVKEIESEAVVTLKVEPLEKTEAMPDNELKQESVIDSSAPVVDSTESNITQTPTIEQKTEMKLTSVVEPEPEVEPRLDVKQELEVSSAPVIETELLSADEILEIGVVRVVFSGDCWFTLKNGEGKTVYADLKRAGDEINYSGSLPFNLVIGAVSAVSVVFEQEPVDFSTVRVRNNRAELELTH